MAKINKNYNLINKNYLFSTVARKIREYNEAYPQKTVIKMSIGDVTKPLTKPVVDALVNASLEMGSAKTFKGYADEQGYFFLQNAIAQYYKKICRVNLSVDEIFISDGAKSDIANITDIFSNENTIVIPDPVYPVYLDSNAMLGRKITLIPGNKENNFKPMPSPDLKGDIIYLCSPNNPTGAVYTHNELQEWVSFALSNNMIILFDNAYEAFIMDNTLPRSIYEIPDAKYCAIEFNSLSKTAGFTGTRCGYTVVPKEIVIEDTSLNGMWLRRQTTKFNGVSYIVQKGAEAVFSDEGYKSCMDNINYYMNNAKIISSMLSERNIWHTGGINSPYIWLECGIDSWSFFDMLLEETDVVGTPGSGFGKAGEGYFRLTAFNTYENTKEATERMRAFFKKHF